MACICPSTWSLSSSARRPQLGLGGLRGEACSNEWVYCPRLAYLEWVEGEWAESGDTAEGRRCAHGRVDEGGGRLPEPDELGEKRARATGQGHIEWLFPGRSCPRGGARGDPPGEVHTPGGGVVRRDDRVDGGAGRRGAGRTLGRNRLGSGRGRSPASRMKARREFSVPLSTGALGVLERARALSPESSLVFPSKTSGQLPRNAPGRVLRRAGVASTVHGFRSSARSVDGGVRRPCGGRGGLPRPCATESGRSGVSTVRSAGASRRGSPSVGRLSYLTARVNLFSEPRGEEAIRSGTRVSLSDRALEILAEARRRFGDSDLVFRSARGKAVTNAVLLNVLQRSGVDGTVHGFRTSFWSWAAEEGVHRQDAEMALAHAVRGVEGAYQCSDPLERRRERHAGVGRVCGEGMTQRVGPFPRSRCRSPRLQPARRVRATVDLMVGRAQVRRLFCVRLTCF